MFTVYNPVADGEVVLMDNLLPSLTMSEMGQTAVTLARALPFFLRVTSFGETARYSLPSYEVESLLRPVFGDVQSRERTALLVVQRRENRTVVFIAMSLSEIWPKVADEARGVIASVRFPDPASYQFVLDPTVLDQRYPAVPGVIYKMRVFYPTVVVSVACTGTGWFSIDVDVLFKWHTSCLTVDHRVGMGKLGRGIISIYVNRSSMPIDLPVSDVKSLTIRVVEQR